MSRKRLRRQPADAMAAILDAAEAGMTVQGPAALRLEDVARRAKVSRPTVLHYFASRDGLIAALNNRMITRMTETLLQTMAEAGNSSQASVAVIFAAFRNGLARRLMWLLQASPGSAPSFEDIIQKAHAARKRHSARQAKAALEDTRRLFRLTLIAAFGEAWMGSLLPEPEFEKWFSAMLDSHIRANTRRSEK